MNDRSWIPEGMLLDKPNPARLYDYLLGGFHNFAADRELAEGMKNFFPEVQVGAVAQRAFARRAVRFLVDQGIDQFLDIGSGLPTAGNVHQIVQAANPNAHVVYVDNDPVVLAHSEILLKDDPNTTLICVDLRDTDGIFSHDDVLDLFDLSRPLAVMLNAVLHYITDDAQAQAAVRGLLEPLTAGSYATISHVSLDGASDKALEPAVKFYRAAAEIRVRTREQIRQFFDGLELVEPGLIRAPLWRPESSDDVLFDHPEHYLGFAGVGRKV
jgi:O-methyltransferase involved in polyketide biosynthesis